MAGFEVTPTMPSSIMACSPPFLVSSRESSSTQGACPSSRIFPERSFTSASSGARSGTVFAAHLDSLHRPVRTVPSPAVLTLLGAGTNMLDPALGATVTLGPEGAVWGEGG